MDNCPHLETFCTEYKSSFPIDWIEDLDWSTYALAKKSCDQGCRLISEFRKITFISIAASLLSCEYIDKDYYFDKVNAEMRTYWEQDHVTLKGKNAKINQLKANLTADYERLDNELRFLFDKYGIVLRTVREKLIESSTMCIFTATSYPTLSENLQDYISALCHLIIPICLFEHQLPYGVDRIRELVTIYVQMDLKAQGEVDDQCKSLFKLGLYKTAFILKKTLSDDSKYSYYLDNTEYIVTRDLFDLPEPINEHFNTFKIFNEDASYNKDEIQNIQNKCFAKTATIKEYIKLFDYYRKNAKQQKQLDNVLNEFKELYNTSTNSLADGFDLYAWRTMLNYLYNCRLSYILNHRKKKPDFDELILLVSEIDMLQQQTNIHNFYPYKKGIEYLISLIKNNISQRRNIDYNEQVSTLETLIDNYESSLDWCKTHNFYPIQLTLSDCVVSGLEQTLVLPSTFSKPIDYSKQFNSLSEFKSELRFIKESLQLFENTAELNTIKRSLQDSEKRFKEIGGIFVGAITFLFGTINIFTNEKASPSQMFVSTLGLGLLLVIFAILMMFVSNKWEWRSFKSWTIAIALCMYTLILCFIIFGGNAFYGFLKGL